MSNPDIKKFLTQLTTGELKDAKGTLTKIMDDKSEDRYQKELEKIENK